MRTTDEIVDPLRVFVSDKEFVKLFVKAVIGDQFNVPTIDVLRSYAQAREYGFPADCCIKPTHLSGTVILRKDGADIDFEKIESWFNRTYYLSTRERNYRQIKRKVIVEPLVFGSDNPSDYKIFCHNGKPRLIQVDLDRYIAHKRKYYDSSWNEMPFSILYPRWEGQIDRPENLDMMLAAAEALSSYFTVVRIDFYSDGKDCFVGEITNCPEGAFGRFIPKSGEAIASRTLFG
jgi:hypothetical protein